MAFQSDGRLLFGEWLPDLPYYENPGLVEAKNVIPTDRHYKDFLPLSTEGGALGSSPIAGFAAIRSDGSPELYAATSTGLFLKEPSFSPDSFLRGQCSIGFSNSGRLLDSVAPPIQRAISGEAGLAFSGGARRSSNTSIEWTDVSQATYNSSSYWRFTQFDDMVIATNGSNEPQYRTVGSVNTQTFADLQVTGNAPVASELGVIHRFTVLGNLDGNPSAVQWSAIDDPTDWPTPASASANAVQSGREILNSGYGVVTAIANGEFWGLVFQQRAITRFTYEGGNTVFQVQTYERERGCWLPRSMVQLGQLTYFISSDGFYVTDGQTVTPIGTGKVDKWFYADFDQNFKSEVTGAIDHINKCVYWVYPSLSAGGVPDRVIVYNYAENRWGWAEDTLRLIFQSFTQGWTLEQLDSLYTSIDDIGISLDSSIWSGGVPVIHGFDTDNKLGTFSGTALTARFETAEMDANPFGYVLIRGLKPLISGNPTNITAQIAARAAQDNEDRAFGAATERTSRTGVCDFRDVGRYVSARIEVAGGFDRAIGVQFDAELDGLV